MNGPDNQLNDEPDSQLNKRRKDDGDDVSAKGNGSTISSTTGGSHIGDITRSQVDENSLPSIADNCGTCGHLYSQLNSNCTRHDDCP